MSSETTATMIAADTPEICGVIMPIADMAGYDPGHWDAMLELTSRAIDKAGLRVQPVWQGGEADVLQERIVRNLYELPIAVCDISGQNPNVMLELGIRLAFGKPTIIINDEMIRAPFDIGSIEYVPYARTLHFQRAEDFVLRLQAKLQSTQERVRGNVYKPFIKTFGPIELGTPGDEAIPLGQAILDQVEQLSGAVRRLEQGRAYDILPIIDVEKTTPPSGESILIRAPRERLSFAMTQARAIPGVMSVLRLADAVKVNLRYDLTADAVRKATSRLDSLQRAVWMGIDDHPDSPTSS